MQTCVYPTLRSASLATGARRVFHENCCQTCCLDRRSDPEVPVMRVVMSDISARKQAEEALLKGGALQSAIFNSANFSSIATDAKGVIQIFNVGAERMLGYTAAEVMN